MCIRDRSCRARRQVSEVNVSGTLLHPHTACECTGIRHIEREPLFFAQCFGAAAVGCPQAFALAERYPVRCLGLPEPELFDVPLE
eukprot:1787394-Pyramimonas_sp.AAC.1